MIMIAAAQESLLYFWGIPQKYNRNNSSTTGRLGGWSALLSPLPGQRSLRHHTVPAYGQALVFKVHHFLPTAVALQLGCVPPSRNPQHTAKFSENVLCAPPQRSWLQVNIYSQYNYIVFLTFTVAYCSSLDHWVSGTNDI